MEVLASASVENRSGYALRIAFVTLIFIIFFSQVTFAGNYGALNYGVGAYGIGEIISSGGGGGGGGGSGGGGGGGGVVTNRTNTTTNATGPVITPPATTTPQLFTLEIPIQSADVCFVKFVVKANGTIPVPAVGASKIDAPTTEQSIDRPYAVYHYALMNVTSIQTENIVSSSIVCNITTAWISQHGFTDSEVIVKELRDGTWADLPTTLVSGTAEYREYETALSSTTLSATLAVLGEKYPQSQQPEEIGQKEAEISYMFLILSGIATTGIFGIIFFLYKFHRPRMPHLHLRRNKEKIKKVTHIDEGSVFSFRHAKPRHAAGKRPHLGIPGFEHQKITKRPKIPDFGKELGKKKNKKS